MTVIMSCFRLQCLRARTKFICNACGRVVPKGITNESMQDISRVLSTLAVLYYNMLITKIWTNYVNSHKKINEKMCDDMFSR